MKTLRWPGWLLLSLLSAIGLSGSLAQTCENETLSLLLAIAGAAFGFLSVWGTRANLHRWHRDISQAAPSYFFFSILGLGLFFSHTAYNPQWQDRFLGATFCLAIIGPLAIVQAKKIREMQYDPLTHHEE